MQEKKFAGEMLQLLYEILEEENQKHEHIYFSLVICQAQFLQNFTAEVAHEH